MRVESSITSISWIPSEAIKGMVKLPFEVGAAHYDQAPPDHIEGPAAIEALRPATGSASPTTFERGWMWATTAASSTTGRPAAA